MTRIGSNALTPTNPKLVLLANMDSHSTIYKVIRILGKLINTKFILRIRLLHMIFINLLSIFNQHCTDINLQLTCTSITN